MSSWFINKVNNLCPSKAEGIDLPEKLKQYMSRKRLNRNHNGELVIKRSLKQKNCQIKVSRKKILNKLKEGYLNKINKLLLR